jgi:hypothetical protein
MKLTYWVCNQETDHQCYNLRARTKREVLEMKRNHGGAGYSQPFKVIVEYKDAFDLMDQCMTEGSIDENLPIEL